MRTAGLPTFTKLYGRNDADVMAQGTYQISVDLSKHYLGDSVAFRRPAHGSRVCVCRLPSRAIRWDQGNRDLDRVLDRWKEPVLGLGLYRRWGAVCSSRNCRNRKALVAPKVS